MTIELSPTQYETRLSWDNAIFYCFSLNIDGKTGWRLPTIDEITELNLNGGFYWCFQDERAEMYWGLITNGMRHLPYDPINYAPSMFGARVDFDSKEECYLVRPVRDLKDNS